MLDTRRHLNTLINSSFKMALNKSLLCFVGSLIAALLVAFVPSYSGLNDDGVMTLFILLFVAGLWVTEAIPAFAVSLLAIALNILLLGFNNFDFADKSATWKTYLGPWSSPLVFLFFAGFIMAAAASKTKLDLWIAKKVLFFVGEKPKNVMTGLMVITFVLSMFISNTATTAMMVTVIAPILASMDEGNPFGRALLLGVAVAANIGGMGTIIGTPPNAIAVGILGERAPSFLGWMIYAVPPAILLAIVIRFILIKLYPSTEDRVSLKHLEEIDHFDDSTSKFDKIPTVPSWKKSTVVLTFFATVLLWLTGPLHHIPTTVVSLLPVVVFTIFGILDVDDVQEIRWDVIILIVGGLSLGMAVGNNGLAVWFAELFDLSQIGLFAVIMIFSIIVVVVSNFMSNTAASNIILPIVVAFTSSMGDEASIVTAVAVALCASCAMALPVSTPPNAIVYASGNIATKDFIRIGLFAGIVSPPILAAWFSLV